MEKQYIFLFQIKCRLKFFCAKEIDFEKKKDFKFLVFKADLRWKIILLNSLCTPKLLEAPVWPFSLFPKKGSTHFIKNHFFKNHKVD